MEPHRAKRSALDANLRRGDVRLNGAAARVGSRPHQDSIRVPDRRGYILRRALIAADVVGIAAAVILSLMISDAIDRRPPDDLVVGFALVPLWLGLMMVAGAYRHCDQSVAPDLSEEFIAVFRTATLWSWILLIVRFGIEQPVELFPSIVLWLAVTGCVLLARAGARAVVATTEWFPQDVAIVGSSLARAMVKTRVDRHPEWGLRMCREYDPEVDKTRAGVNGKESQELLVDRVVKVVQDDRIARVVICSSVSPGLQASFTRKLMGVGVRVDIIPGDLEILRGTASLQYIEGLPILSIPPVRNQRLHQALKRATDLVIALPLLLIASPALVILGLLIRIDSPGPALYSQQRAGRNGRVFSFLKLRTMEDGADRRLEDVWDFSLHGNGIVSGMFKSADDPRVTRVGKHLRRYSVDELPQLWNVVKGDMSLVGPRPLPLAEDERISGHYEARRLLRPGMTGPWQVMGRSDIPFHEMLKLDYAYVTDWSGSGDMRYLLHTIGAVIGGRGAY